MDALRRDDRRPAHLDVGLGQRLPRLEVRQILLPTSVVGLRQHVELVEEGARLAVLDHGGVRKPLRRQGLRLVRLLLDLPKLEKALAPLHVLTGALRQCRGGRNAASRQCGLWSRRRLQPRLQEAAAVLLRCYRSGVPLHQVRALGDAVLELRLVGLHVGGPQVQELPVAALQARNGRVQAALVGDPQGLLVRQRRVPQGLLDLPQQVHGAGEQPGRQVPRPRRRTTRRRRLRCRCRRRCRLRRCRLRRRRRGRNRRRNRSRLRRRGGRGRRWQRRRGRCCGALLHARDLDQRAATVAHARILGNAGPRASHAAASVLDAHVPHVPPRRPQVVLEEPDTLDHMPRRHLHDNGALAAGARAPVPARRLPEVRASPQVPPVIPTRARALSAATVARVLLRGATVGELRGVELRGCVDGDPHLTILVRV
mmetsp:Transcript_6741/g.18633  ORF Transcript_6741/g.18633 Transcript_6741/m.18633 type:complete len:426 (-) Transcript_6741:302-1579(-)